MKRATVLNEIILNLQIYDLSLVERTIDRLNALIANLPAEAWVARDCTWPGLKWKRVLVENNPEWEREDIDYARQCENEKLRSLRRR